TGACGIAWRVSDKSAKANIGRIIGGTSVRSGKSHSAAVQSSPVALAITSQCDSRRPPDVHSSCWERGLSRIVRRPGANRTREEAMSAKGLDVFDRTLETTHIWLNEICDELGPDKQVAWKV